MARRALMLREGKAPVRDRLLTMLFLAALLHGLIILGLTFNASAGAPLERPGPGGAAGLGRAARGGQATTTPPILRSAPSSARATRARRSRRATAPQLRAVPAHAGVARGRLAAATAARRPAAPSERVLTTTAWNTAGALPRRHGGARRHAQTARCCSSSQPTDAARARGRAGPAQLRGPEARRAVGNARHPRRHARALPGCLAPQGRAHRHAQLTRPPRARAGTDMRARWSRWASPPTARSTRPSSAARAATRSSTRRRSQILKLASPFDPFPPELARQYRVLRFAYEWQFVGGRRRTAAARVSTVP